MGRPSPVELPPRGTAFGRGCIAQGVGKFGPLGIQHVHGLRPCTRSIQGLSLPLLFAETAGIRAAGLQPSGRGQLIGRRREAVA
eukprot:10587992-Lingulodinium_polyedra.AAC.1